MPLCTIKMFEGELTEAQAADLIHYVTEPDGDLQAAGSKDPLGSAN